MFRAKIHSAMACNLLRCSFNWFPEFDISLIIRFITSISSFIFAHHQAQEYETLTSLPVGWRRGLTPVTFTNTAFIAGMNNVILVLRYPAYF
jgi:DMSO reductase anchor subunit